MEPDDKLISEDLLRFDCEEKSDASHVVVSALIKLIMEIVSYCDMISTQLLIITHDASATNTSHNASRAPNCCQTLAIIYEAISFSKKTHC